MSMTETAPAPSFLQGLTAEELDTFSEQAGKYEFDGNMTREEAERMAYNYVMNSRKKGSRSAIEPPTDNPFEKNDKTHDPAPENAPIAVFNGLQALTYCTNKGIKLGGCYENKAYINNTRAGEKYEEIFTNDIAEIKALIAGLGDSAGRAQGKKIELFRFFPADYGFLCIDIDRAHKSGADGLKNLYAFFDSIGKTKENLPPYLRNLPQSFPCYVTTPSGGFHLYFRYSGNNPKKALKGLDYENNSVEIFYKTFALSAPGSKKPGGEYILYGDFDNAPLLPAFIKNRLNFSKNEQPPKYTAPPAPGYSGKKYNGSTSWDKLREWVEKDGTYSGRNDRAFAFAVKARSHGWEKSDTLRALRAEASLEGLQESEYVSVVNSAYSKGA